MQSGSKSSNLISNVFIIAMVEALPLSAISLTNDNLVQTCWNSPRIPEYSSIWGNRRVRGGYRGWEGGPKTRITLWPLITQPLGVYNLIYTQPELWYNFLIEGKCTKALLPQSMWTAEYKDDEDKITSRFESSFSRGPILLTTCPKPSAIIITFVITFMFWELVIPNVAWQPWRRANGEVWLFLTALNCPASCLKEICVGSVKSWAPRGEVSIATELSESTDTWQLSLPI